MEPSAQRHCPRCGTPVAQRAETCLMCGAQLKEHRAPNPRISPGAFLWPLLLMGLLAILWSWKPWQIAEPAALLPNTATATPTATLSPTPTLVVAPTATPLRSPTPPPTATLPPNQTHHTVESGEVIGTIAKKYGATVDAILKANNLKANSIISVGQVLIIPLPVADTPTPTLTPTPSPTPFEYTVRANDTLSAIAKRYNTTVEALMEANNIADATRISIGTKLIIVQPPDYSATMAFETYEVTQGDTLSTIAQKFNLSAAELREINNLSNDKLSVGQKLRIPIGTATPAPTPTVPPTLTPTPGPWHPATALLSPPDQTTFEGAEAVIVLNWTSVGILAEDEWYVLRMRRSGTYIQQLPALWTKATSWRLPADLYIPDLAEPQEFYWQVTVLRQTGLTEDGTRTGDPISPPSGSRTFFWK